MLNELAEEVRRKNRTLNQWEQYYGRDRLASCPTHIQFPTGTRCNLRCSFCTERGGPGAVHYQYHDLSFDDFSRIIADPQWQKALVSVGTIALYGWGEPLFNKEYEAIADSLLCSFPGIRISISTNGVLFDEGWAEKFVSHDTGDINVSLNAATPATFLRLTGSDQFRRVVDNVRALIKLRRDWGSVNPAITLSFVATTENVRELPAFVELAAGLQVDSVIVQDIMTLNERTAALSLANAPELARSMFALARDRARERGIQLAFISFETHGEEYFPSTAEMSDQAAGEPQVAPPAALQPGLPGIHHGERLSTGLPGDLERRRVPAHEEHHQQRRPSRRLRRLPPQGWLGLRGRRGTA
ncbi:MAG TPA: radical SAM protein [Geomonas sp.]|nr:radical SAM protein [Geomonas sp.]